MKRNIIFLTLLFSLINSSLHGMENDEHTFTLKKIESSSLENILMAIESIGVGTSLLGFANNRYQTAAFNPHLLMAAGGLTAVGSEAAYLLIKELRPEWLIKETTQKKKFNSTLEVFNKMLKTDLKVIELKQNNDTYRNRLKITTQSSNIEALNRYLETKNWQLGDITQAKKRKGFLEQEKEKLTQDKSSLETETKTLKKQFDQLGNEQKISSFDPSKEAQYSVQRNHVKADMDRKQKRIEMITQQIPVYEKGIQHLAIYLESKKNK